MLNHSQSSHAANSKPQSLRALGEANWFSWLRAILLGSLICLVAVGGTLELAGCGSSRDTIIEIASDLPISGDEAVNGLPIQDGVQMAINEANNENLLSGYTLELVSYDDTGGHNRYDPQKGAQNVEKAIADNLVAGIIGPVNSAVAYAEMPITNQAPIAQISSNTSYPCLTKSETMNPYCSGTNEILPQVRPTSQLTYFRLATTDDVQGKADADYLLTTKHYQRVILFEDNADLYSSGLAQAFQQEWQSLGGQVISQNLPEATSSEQDYQSALQALAPTQPDLVYFVGTDPNGSYALQALTNIPEFRTVAFAGSDGIADHTLLNTAITLHLSAPVYASMPIKDPAHSGTTLGQNFQRQFQAHGYSNYYPYAASAYDSTRMLIQAIKTALQRGASTPSSSQDQVGAKTFRQAVLQALRQNMYTDTTGTHSSYTGAMGTQSFDSNGDTTDRTISFYQLNLAAGQPAWSWLDQRSG